MKFKQIINQYLLQIGLELRQTCWHYFRNSRKCLWPLLLSPFKQNGPCKFTL